LKATVFGSMRTLAPSNSPLFKNSMTCPLASPELIANTMIPFPLASRASRLSDGNCRRQTGQVICQKETRTAFPGKSFSESALPSASESVNPGAGGRPGNRMTP
jgi:hypothetical protein